MKTVHLFRFVLTRAWREIRAYRNLEVSLQDR